MLRAVIEVAVLAVLHPRKNLPLRRAIAFQLVRDDHPGHVGQALEEFAEELLRRLLVPTTLDENIQHVAVLVHSTPQGMPLTVDRQKHLLQMPLVTRPWAPAPELIGLRWPKLPAPLPERFRRHADPTDAQECFHVAIAEAEAIVQPDAVAHDFGRKPMMFVALWSGWRSHAGFPDVGLYG